MFQIPEDLPEPLFPLAWMLGRWEGVGLFSYPTIEAGRFGQELDITNDGRDFFAWSSRTWVLDEEGNRVRQHDTESGFLRIRDDKPELMLAHPTGVVEIFTGTIEPAKLLLPLSNAMRTASADEYVQGERMYGLVNGELFYAVDMEAQGHPMSTYMSAQLRRV